MKIRTFDYILMICGGLVLSESAMIITLNTKRAYWEAINKFHVLVVMLYLVYLSTVIYSSVECNRSDYYCDLLWKTCSTLYIAVNMAVYSFYYVRSTVVNNILWRGKTWSRRLVIIAIVMMGVCGLCFFWPPINGVQYYAFLIRDECYLADRRWIVIFWVTGDSFLSILLLILFIRPVEILKRTLGETPRSVARFRTMRRMTEKNRNLLLFSVMITIGMYTTIAVFGKLHMRTVIYMCAVERLVTLQCITMTFTYDWRQYFCCRACFLLFSRTQEIEDEEQSYHYQAMNQRNSESTSWLALSNSGISNSSN